MTDTAQPPAIDAPPAEGRDHLHRADPDRLLGAFGTSRLAQGIVVALLVHVIVVLATSVGYFLNLTQPDEQTQAAVVEQADAEQAQAEAEAQAEATTVDRNGDLPGRGDSPVERGLQATEEPPGLDDDLPGLDDL